MFDRFTDHAALVLHLSHRIAMESQHEWISPEHILAAPREPRPCGRRRGNGGPTHSQSRD
jgi:hypothetical protein